jgi:hypothetical protein
MRIGPSILGTIRLPSKNLRRKFGSSDIDGNSYI